MITRKVAREVMKQWYKHLKNEDANGLLCNVMGEVAFKDQLDKFIEQFPDEPTPDEMLAEMREWADYDVEGRLYFYEENPYRVNISFRENKKSTYRLISNSDRTEAITEAYRQFKEATK